MVVGDAMDFYELVDETSGQSGLPDWSFDYNFYEYNGSITCSFDGVDVEI